MVESIGGLFWPVKGYLGIFGEVPNRGGRLIPVNV